MIQFLVHAIAICLVPYLPCMISTCQAGPYNGVRGTSGAVILYRIADDKSTKDNTYLDIFK
jgi:hypothetical protein